MIKKYKRKSDFVEAVQWTGENKEEIEALIGKECNVDSNGVLTSKDINGYYIRLYPEHYVIKDNDDEFVALNSKHMTKVFNSYDSILDIVKVEYKEVSERYEIIENLLKDKTPQELLEEYGPQKTVTLSGIDMVMDKYLRILKEQIESIEEEEKKERDNKPKVMLSQPMNGKTDEEIAATKEKAVSYLEGKGYEVINTLFTDEWYSKEKMQQRGIKQIPLCFLAKSLESMSLCDAAYFCEGWEEARGCRIEHDAALAYGLKIIYEKDTE